MKLLAMDKTRRRISIVLELCFFLTGLGLMAPLSTGATDLEKPYGRACLTLFDSLSGKEELFKRSAAHKAGTTIRVHVDSSSPCAVLLAAFTKEGKLANAWRPELANLIEEFDEVELPKAPAKWDWSKPSPPFDVYVCFLSPNASELEQTRKLVAAMNDPKVPEPLLAMQTNKLRELFGRITSKKEKGNQAAVSEPEVGGSIRGSRLDATFPWRQLAATINFSEGTPGLLILSNNDSGKSNNATPHS